VLISLFYAPLLICFVTSTKLTTAANAIFLQYIAPAIVLVIEPKILGVRMKRYNLITVLLCIFGLSFFLFEQKSTGHHWLGDGLALLSGFFSAGLLLSLRFSNRSQQMSGILLGNILVVLVTLPFFIKSPPATGAEHFMLAFLGLIQIGLGFLLFTFGQRRIPAVESSLIAMIEPIFNPVWVVIWYGEQPAIWSIIGGIIILTTLALRMIFLKRLESTAVAV
jgi:drug/metabolite transporter (DMT)-like permease